MLGPETLLSESTRWVALSAYRIKLEIIFEPTDFESKDEPVTLKGEFTIPDGEVDHEGEAEEWFTELWMDTDECKYVDCAGAAFWDWEAGFGTTLEITDCKLIK